ALIGEADANSGDEIGTDSRIDVIEGVEVLAKVDGELWAFTVAGSVVASKSPDNPTPMDDPTDPRDGVSRPNLFGDGPPADQQAAPKTGVGIAGSVSLNLVTDTTQASIADAAQLSAGSATVDAINEFGIVAASGLIAFAKVNPGSTAVALAGAFSFNHIDSTT